MYKILTTVSQTYGNFVTLHTEYDVYISVPIAT